MGQKLEDHQQLGKWPGEQERKPITDAMRELWEIASRDCYEAPAYIENCNCERCVASRAVRVMQAALYPKVRSLTPERLKSGYAELLFFEAWKAANERVRGINGGRGTLEILLEELGPITQRDMDVASTVIQWLGTNCGGAFLRDVERQIERIRDEGSKIRNERMQKVVASVDSIGITRGALEPGS